MSHQLTLKIHYRTLRTLQFESKIRTHIINNGNKFTYIKFTYIIIIMQIRAARNESKYKCVGYLYDRNFAAYADQAGRK